MPKICQRCGGAGKIITAEEARKRFGKSPKRQTEIAKLMHISPTHLSDLLLDRRSFSAVTEKRFLEALK